jgi:2-dehydropantoate 2-reductase
MQSYSIIGTGGLGGHYGCSLFLADADVRFLLRSDADLAGREGLRYDRGGQQHQIPAAACYGDAARLPVSDVVCICLKTTQNQQLPGLLEACCGPDTAILIMQNGLGIDEQVLTLDPRRAVIGVSCFLCAHKAGPGHIVHEDYGRIELAAANQAGAARLPDIIADFQQAGIQVDTVDDLGLLRWRKLVWNIPFNGLCALLDVSTTTLLADADMRAQARAIMAEVCAAAQACGVGIQVDVIDRMLEATAAMTPYRPSMHLDRLAGRAMEIDAMYRGPIRRARAVGCPMPRTELLTAQLGMLESEARGRGAGPSDPRS